MTISVYAIIPLDRPEVDIQSVLTSSGCLALAGFTSRIKTKRPGSIAVIHFEASANMWRAIILGKNMNTVERYSLEEALEVILF